MSSLLPLVTTQSQIQIALRSFILSALPAGWDCIEGQDSQVSEPEGVDFVVMTPITRKRLSTNYTAWADCKITGSVSGAVLTCSSVFFGSVQVGSTLWGPGLPSGLTVLSQINGVPGGAGTYTLSGSATIASGPMACGLVVITCPTQVGIQLDFHSADIGDASDAVETIQTLFRSEIATAAFDATGYAVAPLYADDPIQRPWENAEQQYETLWTLMAYVQANQAISWGQQFAEQLQVTIIPAEGIFGDGIGIDFTIEQSRIGLL